MSDEELISFIQEANGESHLRVQDELGDGFVRLRSAEAERRQAKQDIRCIEDALIEMLRNSRDAGARTLFVATGTEADKRFITIIDNGSGIPERMHNMVFEPRVTSKLDTFHEDRWGVHGRGMALYSIRQNCESARVVSSEPTLGTAIEVISDPNVLTEKRDQSTYPVALRENGSAMILRGPHNLVRTAMEFAIDERRTMTVYFGSANEIAATLYSYGKAIGKPSAVPLDEDAWARVPLVQRLSLCATPKDFASQASLLGLKMSERSARRILDGEVDQVDPLIELLAAVDLTPQQKDKSRPEKHDRPKDARGLKLDSDDTKRFLDSVTSAFGDLARDYYLEPDVEPTLRVRNDALYIKVPLSKLR